MAAISMAALRAVSTRCRVGSKSVMRQRDSAEREIFSPVASCRPTTISS
jgi:hypothetical protein